MPFKIIYLYLKKTHFLDYVTESKYKHYMLFQLKLPCSTQNKFIGFNNFL